MRMPSKPGYFESWGAFAWFVAALAIAAFTAGAITYGFLGVMRACSGG
jgi:hypothetical protein